MDPPLICGDCVVVASGEVGDALVLLATRGPSQWIHYVQAMNNRMLEPHFRRFFPLMFESSVGSGLGFSGQLEETLNPGLFSASLLDLPLVLVCSPFSHRYLVSVAVSNFFLALLHTVGRV